MTTDVPELLVVTGMSGAGKTAVTALLDDLGWFVVDNLPPSLVAIQLVDTVTERTSQRRIAVVADVRGGVFFRELRGALDELAARGVPPARVVPRGGRRGPRPTIRVRPATASVAGRRACARRDQQGA